VIPFQVPLVRHYIPSTSSPSVSTCCTH